ncbi:hypothetical protein F2Q69_00063502 [Brassica cretica]|uniref:Longin domain-containing protein n=1 Tax=Brassica cretica TaxID=69181 RepID=A0A8S9RQF5_BRACR|nr:hypothetical protein F2Q69_00063502 [Brassica cretica]
MQHLLFAVVLAEVAVILALSFKTPIRKLLIMSLDRAKRGRGPVVVQTVSATVCVVLVASVYSMMKIQKRWVEEGAMNPTDEVIMSKHLLESTLMGKARSLLLRVCYWRGKKMVKMTLIARVTDGLPLAEGLDDGRDLPDSDMYKQQVKSLFKNLSRENFSYIIEGRVCYLTMCDRSYPKKLAFQYLEDLKNEFERVNGPNIETAARPYAFIKFDTFIQKTKKLYQDTRTQRNIAKLNDELYEVHQIMTRNVQEVLGVGEKLDQVSEMSSRLTSESRIYADKAKDLNRQALIRKWAPVAIVLGVVFLLFWVKNKLCYHKDLDDLSRLGKCKNDYDLNFPSSYLPTARKVLEITSINTMQHLLFAVVLAEVAVILALSFKTPIRKLLIMSLDRAKRGRGPVVVQTVSATVCVVLVASVYSMMKIQKRWVEEGAMNPTDEVIMSKHLLESTLMGKARSLLLVRSGFGKWLLVLLNRKLVVERIRDPV